MLLERLKLLNKQLKDLDEMIISLYNQFDCYLHTIPSITPISAASLLAEIGDIRRFKNSSSLVAYAGIDPTVRQSANTIQLITECPNADPLISGILYFLQQVVVYFIIVHLMNIILKNEAKANIT